LVAAAAVIGTGIIGLAGTAQAADPVTIAFKAKGIDAGGKTNATSVSIAPGTDVVFVNKIDPTQSVPVLGGLTGALHSVSVTVSGATQKAFTVARGQQQTVSGYSSGSTPFVIHFNAVYQATDLLGGKTKAQPYRGTITVAATPAAPSSTSSPTGGTSTPPPASPTGTSPSNVAPSAGAPTPTAGNSGSGPRSAGAPTVPSYSLPPPDVASEVMPHGSGGAYRSESPTGSAAAGSPSGSRLPATAGPTQRDSTAGSGDGSTGQQGSYNAAEQQRSTRNSAQEQPLNTTAEASPAGALPFDVNWPAIAALALLSTVAGALVRTFVAHRRS
jgi:hypothetical protein